MKIFTILVSMILCFPQLSIASKDELKTYVVIEQIANRKTGNINCERLDFILPLLADIEKNKQSKVIFFTDYAETPDIFDILSKSQKKGLKKFILYTPPIQKPSTFQGKPKSLIQLLGTASQYGSIEKMIVIANKTELNTPETFSDKDWLLLTEHFHLTAKEVYFLSTGSKQLDQWNVGRNFLSHILTQMGVKSLYFNLNTPPFKPTMTLAETTAHIERIGKKEAELLNFCLTLTYANGGFNKGENDLDLVIVKGKQRLCHNNSKNSLGEWFRGEKGSEIITMRVSSDDLDSYLVQIINNNNALIEPTITVTNSKGDFLVRKTWETSYFEGKNRTISYPFRSTITPSADVIIFKRK